MDYKKLKEKVYNYNTKYDIGYLPNEIDNLLEEYPNINKDKFDTALRGVTCQSKEGKLVIYYCDILLALKCGLENRDVRLYEWD